MNVFKLISERYSPGEIFTIEDVLDLCKTRTSLLVIISRLAAKGKIAKLRNGAYYIPAQRQFFGIPKPSKEEVVKYLCKRTKGYLSGYSLYNMMGLTEQVPNIIVIACKNFTPGVLSINGRLVKLIKAHCSPSSRNLFALHILDVLMNVLIIPGRSPQESYERLLSLVSCLTTEKLLTLVNCAKEYPPRTRYLCSCILEDLGYNELSFNLLKTINPSTLNGYKYSRLIPRN